MNGINIHPDKVEVQKGLYDRIVIILIENRGGRKSHVNLMLKEAEDLLAKLEKILKK